MVFHSTPTHKHIKGVYCDGPKIVSFLGVYLFGLFFLLLLLLHYFSFTFPFCYANFKCLWHCIVYHSVHSSNNHHRIAIGFNDSLMNEQYFFRSWRWLFLSSFESVKKIINRKQKVSEKSKNDYGSCSWKMLVVQNKARQHTHII